MPNSPHTKHLFLSALLSAWEASGHSLGVGDYLRMQKLIQDVPDDSDLAALKTQLSPLLVHDKEQQQDFYELFDKTLDEINAFNESDDTDELTDSKRPSNRRWWLIGTVLFIGLLAVLWVYNSNKTPDKTNPNPQNPIAVDSPKQVTKPIFDTVKVKTPDSIEAKTLPLKDTQHSPDISTLTPKEGGYFSGRYAYMSPLKWLIIGILSFALWVLAWWLRRRRQKLIMNYKPNDKPPYLWSFTIANNDAVAFDEDFNRVNNQLRRRSDLENRRFDIKNTVKATILRGGVVDFKYRHLTRSNEYLVLIDRHTPQNHRAQLFNFLYQTFNENEVPVERFFYDNDIRLCWNEQHKRGLSIGELQSKYPEHRLIVFGSAMSLLSPTTGRLQNWVSIFDNWRIKTLLTPRPIHDWDSREEILATKFRILPSTLRGIGDLVETLEANEPKDYRLWQTLNNTDDAPLHFPENLKPENIIALLESEFCPYAQGKTDDRLLQWIAACAVSPVLHWDWTLHVVSKIDNATDLLTLDNLFKINRLSWFVEGKIPDKVRIALLDWLAKEHPTVILSVREEWQKVLDDNEPNPDSVAYEDHKLQSLFNQLQLNAPNRKQLLDEIEKRLPFNEDAVIIEYLKREPTPLDVLVPQRFRKYVRDTEGYIPRLKDWVWQVPLIALFALGIYFYNPNPITEECNGVKVIYKNQQYCVSSPQDSLIIWEYLICDTIRVGTNSKYIIQPYSFPIKMPAETAGGETIVANEQRFMEDYMISEAQSIIRKNALDSSSLYNNIAIAYYNTAVVFFNTQQRDKACLYANKLEKWMWKDSVLTKVELKYLKEMCSSNNSIGNTFKNKLKDPTTLTISNKITNQFVIDSFVRKPINLETVPTPFKPTTSIKKENNLKSESSIEVLVFDNVTRKKIDGSTIVITTMDGKLLTTETIKGNQFRWSGLEAGKTYRVSASKETYDKDEQKFITAEFDTTTKIEYQVELFLAPFSGLPLTLYFHNDEPDANSREMTTAKTYGETFLGYYNRQYEYLAASDRKSDSDNDNFTDSISNFFSNRLRYGYEKLQEFSPLLYNYLSNGYGMELVLRGYASPVSETEHNRILTSRRVSAVINHFYKYQNGLFREFISKGQLRIRVEPNGEDKATFNASDNLKNRKKSIYGLRAMKERRVEIIEISRFEFNSKEPFNLHESLGIYFDYQKLGNLSSEKSDAKARLRIAN